MKKVVLLIFLSLTLVACQSSGMTDASQPEKTCLVCGQPVADDADSYCPDCLGWHVDEVIAICKSDTSRNPILVLEHLMLQDYCPMHGPLHHVLVGASLLTAYRNAGGCVDIDKSLPELICRCMQIPGGACGYWGACGASLSAGIFMSIVTHNSPLATESWHLSNLLTSRALEQVADNGGPRCCKRDSYLSILATVDFVKEHLGIAMAKPQVQCSRSLVNQQCIGQRCPFSPQR